EGLSVDEVFKLLAAVRNASEDVRDEDVKSELLAAVDDLRAEVQAATPNTGAVVRKATRLKAVAAEAGGAGLIAGVSGVMEALTALVMAGAFG
ncbi:MAG: hypothetical protein GX868_11180, partial [Actinobacteria bacterium]|nr:hypothetical protein [Actinomycetota bacterium]